MILVEKSKCLIRFSRDVDYTGDVQELLPPRKAAFILSEVVASDNL